MADRKLCRISPEIGKLLVSQISHELKNHALYLSYANYFSVEGIIDIEEYYRKNFSVRCFTRKYSLIIITRYRTTDFI